MTTAIRVQGISKRYHLGRRRQGYLTLRESVPKLVHGLADRLRGRIKQSRHLLEFWALKDASFEVQQGEVVGIIGHNGAGKSTLLKILSRIVEPTSGRAEIHGRVGSLLEVGTGFHPELTGRENIYLNGAILGMKRHEINRKFHDIVAFSEIEQFLDTPVKRYSSGMYVRLAFAVASHLEPEILLVDEVLSVGDASFQQRCLRKMHDISRSGRTVFFVSHNLASVRSLCQRAIILNKGHLVSQGDADSQVAEYIAGLYRAANTNVAQRTDRSGNAHVRITSLEIIDAEKRVCSNAVCGQPLHLRIGYDATQIGARAEIFITFVSDDGHELFYLGNRASGTLLPPLQRRGYFQCRVDRVPLVPGRYHLNVRVELGFELADFMESVAIIEVLPGDFFNSGGPPTTRNTMIFVDHDWLV